MRVIVLGGGFVGWLAGWLSPSATVLDWRRPPGSVGGHAPRMMGAMYLHEPLEGLTCDRFVVHTTIDGSRATYESASAYKDKVFKPEDMESATWNEQFPALTFGYHVRHWPSIPDIRYGAVISRIDPFARQVFYTQGRGNRHVLDYDILISAIPLYSLMELLHRALPTPLHYVPIAVRSLTAPPDVPTHVRDMPDRMYIDYRSEAQSPVYRVTDYKGVRYYEWLVTDKKNAPFVGIPSKVIRPGKIWASPWVDDVLREFRTVDIYPFGRAARWAPNELIHNSYRDMLEFFRTLGA